MRAELIAIEIYSTRFAPLAQCGFLARIGRRPARLILTETEIAEAWPGHLCVAVGGGRRRRWAVGGGRRPLCTFCLCFACVLLCVLLVFCFRVCVLLVFCFRVRVLLCFASGCPFCTRVLCDLLQGPRSGPVLHRSACDLLRPLISTRVRLHACHSYAFACVCFACDRLVFCL